MIALQVKRSDYSLLFFYYFIGFFILSQVLLAETQQDVYFLASYIAVLSLLILKRWYVFKSRVFHLATWKLNTAQRLRLEFIWSLKNGLLFLTLILLGFMAFKKGISFNALDFIWCVTSCLLYSLLVNFGGEFLHVLASVNRTRKRIDQEKNEVIKLKQEVLQDLISPHFLFNSLNTISTFISENKDKSIQIVKELSDLYGFILNNSHKTVVFLKEDLELAKKYAFLLKTRLENGVSINFDVGTAYYSCYIPPMTIQNLVENCIKHNVVSRKLALEIEIYVENDYLIVKNNLNPKINSGVGSTNLGLNYIKSQVAQLIDQKVTIEETQKEFKVSIPLIYEVNRI